jgi:hypothetical protein
MSIEVPGNAGIDEVTTVRTGTDAGMITLSTVSALGRSIGRLTRRSVQGARSYLSVACAAADRIGIGNSFRRYTVVRNVCPSRISSALKNRSSSSARALTPPRPRRPSSRVSALPRLELARISHRKTTVCRLMGSVSGPVQPANSSGDFEKSVEAEGISAMFYAREASRSFHTAWLSGL